MNVKTTPICLGNIRYVHKVLLICLICTSDFCFYIQVLGTRPYWLEGWTQ